MLGRVSIILFVWMVSVGCTAQTGIVIDIASDSDASMSSIESLQVFVGYPSAVENRYIGFAQGGNTRIGLDPDHELSRDPYRLLLRKGIVDAQEVMVVVAGLDGEGNVISVGELVEPVVFVDDRVLQWAVMLAKVPVGAAEVTNSCLRWGDSTFGPVDDQDCDGCREDNSGSTDNDGADLDGDGLCDIGDPDDDNDGVMDVDDNDPTNPNACSDVDADFCDDCASGSFDPNNDGPDADLDGICNAVSKIAVRTIGTNGRSFSTISAWEEARGGNLITRKILSVSPVPGVNFQPGERVVGPGCTGTYVPENAASITKLKLTMDDYTGDCVDGDVLVGQVSGATAVFHKIVVTGTRERAVLHKDSVFTENVVIDGSTTDAQHYMHITVAPTSRHRGVEGTGVVIDPPGSGHGILILDDFTVVDGVEVTDWTNSTEAGSHDGISISATGVVVENVIVHDDGHGTELDSDANGIALTLGSFSATVRNSIVYNIARLGIGIHQAAGATMTVENCTVFRCVQEDGLPDNYGCVGITRVENSGAKMHVYNTIAMGADPQSRGDFVMGGGGSWGITESNMSSDSTAPGQDLMDPNALVNLVPEEQFVSIGDLGNLEQVDLHLKSTSQAIDRGINLSSTFVHDIDRDPRPVSGPWDIGADEQP